MGSFQASLQRSRLLALPVDLHLAILSKASDVATLATTLSACKALRGLEDRAWYEFCHREFPRCAAAAEAVAPPGSPGSLSWRQVAFHSKVMKLAADATPDPDNAFRGIYNWRRRMILVEWLIEVSVEFHLDGSAVFLATRLLDHYLAVRPPEKTSILQLIGVSCLYLVAKRQHEERAQEAQAAAGTMDDPNTGSVSSGGSNGASSSISSTAAGGDSTSGTIPGREVPTADRYAFMTDGACTAEEVEEMRAAIETVLREDPAPAESPVPAPAGASAPAETPPARTSLACPPAQLLTAPTARHFWRCYYWAAATRQPADPLDWLNSRGPPLPFPAPRAGGAGSTSAAAALGGPEAAAEQPAPLLPAHFHKPVQVFSSFLLHLSLVCPKCSAASPAALAAAALSLALEVVGLPAWPEASRGVLPLCFERDVEPLRQLLCELQANTPEANVIRRVWRRKAWAADWHDRWWLGVGRPPSVGPVFGSATRAVLWEVRRRVVAMIKTPGRLLLPGHERAVASAAAGAGAGAPVAPVAVQAPAAGL